MTYTENSFIEYTISKLDASMPAIFSRKELEVLLGKALSAGTLANFASTGCSAPFIRNGRNAIYEKTTFLKWFKLYLEGGKKAIVNNAQQGY